MKCVVSDTRPSPHSSIHRALGANHVVLLLIVATIALLTPASLAIGAQTRTIDSADQSVGEPEAGRLFTTLIPAQSLQLTGSVDSNSPAVWDRVDGRLTLFVFTSFAGRLSRAVGSLSALGPASEITLEPWPGGGVWMEAVVPAPDGTWYGYYHNENPAVCDATKVAPRIGAARSIDRGETWTDLGILIESPDWTFTCHTSNRYFVGGVGDLSATLDRSGDFLYLYFSQYGRIPAQQGIAVARLAWADRDAPVGKIDIWSEGVWLPPRAPEIDSSPNLVSGSDVSNLRWEIPDATAIFPTTRPWHDADLVVNAFWGASVHWNEFLQQYVMLLNRSADENFAQEGIYVSFSATPEHPASWSTPRRIMAGGQWYPQVIGLDAYGTDKQAGRVARFFMAGRSNYLLRFDRAVE